MKNKIGKWQFVFSWNYAYERIGGHRLIFGIFKLKSLPSEGCMITNENYDGFIINKYFEPFSININL